MKAVIYARVSSKDQEETGYSLSAQEELLKQYAVKKGYDVVRVFSISESASGKRQREVFNQMMQYVTKQNIKIVICEKADRLSRNFKDMVQVDEWLEEDKERQMHLVKDSLVLHRDSRSQEKLNWGIRILFAKNYIDNLSEEVKKGLAEKLRQGWLPTKPPVGYKTLGEKGHKIHVIDEDKAYLVRKMFELYSTGNYGTDTLADMMFKEGLRNAGGKRIYKSRVAVLLTDPFYIGKIRYNDAIHKGAHERLISDELFEIVQRNLKGNGAPRYRRHSPTFKSLIKCEECGGSVTWEIQKGHWYGHCNRYRECTQKKFVRQERVEEQLLPYLDEITIKNPRVLEWVKRAMKESHADEIAYSSSAREELNKRFESVQRRLEALYDDKLDGKIPEDFYQRKFKQFTEEKDQIISTLKRHDGANTKYYELGSNVLDLAQRAKEIYLNENRTADEKRILLRLVFSNLVINADKLTVSYNKAFQILSTYSGMWNKKFEPTESGSDKRQKGTSVPSRPILLPLYDEIRTHFEQNPETD